MRSTWLCLVACTACTFGGSSQDPTVELELDGSVDSATGTRAQDAGPLTMRADATVAVSKPDASPGEGGSDASIRADESVVLDGATSTASCLPSEPVSTCDPVRNTDCPPLSQCDVDTDMSTPAGRCVFMQLALGDECSASALGTTCAPQFACVDRACEKLCYCASDCPPGNCCTTPTGPGTSFLFNVCRPC